MPGPFTSNLDEIEALLARGVLRSLVCALEARILRLELRYSQLPNPNNKHQMMLKPSRRITCKLESL